MDASRTELITEPRPASGTGKSSGVSFGCRFTELPEIQHGNVRIHAGRFWAERRFDPALEVGERRFLDFHLRADHHVPATIYVGPLHSDIDLHPGEQIVRIDLNNFRGSGFDERWDGAVESIAIELWPADNYPDFPHPAMRELHDTTVSVYSLTATDARPTPDTLPHGGKAIWLSAFRPNRPRRIAVPRDKWNKYLRRQKTEDERQDRTVRHLRESFRTFTSHRVVSPIRNIVIGTDAADLEREAATELQDLIEAMLDVRLPVVEADGGSPRGANAIVLGQAARRTGLVGSRELEYVGKGGFVINAHGGSIGIAGPGAAGTAHGAVHYAENHGVRFYEPDAPLTPRPASGFLHELYFLDRPRFRSRPVAGGWKLMADGTGGSGIPAGTDAAGREDARKIADRIKELARDGKQTIPRELARRANATALSRYVAAKLLWNPYADATCIVRRFSEAATQQAAR